MTTETLTQIFEAIADEVASKLGEAEKAETPWQKRRKKVAQFAKDFGPLFTGGAAILVSLSIGVLTATISYFTYQSNVKQAAANQINLRTTALNDFADSEKEKRTLAAIRVAAHGEDALPIIRFALGVDSNEIRAGGVASAQFVYQANPECRQKLLSAMAQGFQDANPKLRLGILEFYRDAAPQMTPQEQAAFWNLLKTRLGPQAQSCVTEEADFVFNTAQFLAKGLFPDAKDYLLNMVRNCPHENGNQKYSGARNQAVGVLSKVLKERHASKSERDQTVKDLRALEKDASEELKVYLTAAITNIEEIQGP